jgi:hypothetical protein
LKVGVTDCAALMLTVQTLLTPQPPPLQPANTLAAEEGVAVKVTEAPLR